VRESVERENIYKGSTFNMKCQYCGAVLNLTDEVCPHCGRKNRAGEAYKKDYDKYQSKVNTADSTQIQLIIEESVKNKYE
jgi:rRNA maturation endonuclease Nob1